MVRAASSPLTTRSALLPVASLALALGIFLFDTLSPIQMATAVLYSFVVLLSSRFLSTRGLLFVALGCAGLAILSYLIAHRFGSPAAATLRLLVSLGAIGATAFLAVEDRASNLILLKQAQLLDLTHDMIFVRNMNALITYWNRGAEEAYGWKPENVVGKAVAHNLLKTVFPRPLDEIMAELLRSGRWEGELIHTKADGTEIVVASRWTLQRDRQQRPLAILESNTDVTERKRATEALQQSEAQWREVFEHNPVMYFMVDPAGTVISVNTFGATQLGYSVNELLGQSVMNVFFEPDKDFVRERLAACIAQPGQSHSWEVRKIRKDGSVIWVRENAKAVRRQDGLIILAACEDITERKKNEDQLRRSRAYLSEAQRLSQTGSVGWNATTGEVVWSEETYRIFGYDRAIGATLEVEWQRTHPDDRQRVRDAFERAARAGEDLDLEHRLLMPDGSVKFVHLVATCVKDASGGVEFVGAVMDVTASKEAEARTRQIIDTVPTFIWTARADGSTDYLNKRYLDYNGMTLSEALGSGWGGQIHPDDYDQAQQKWQTALAKRQPYEAETRIRRYDGEYRWSLSRAVPLLNGLGAVLRWYGSETDIHDRILAEEALRKVQADLAHVTRVTTLGELTASIAHEVNQPLAAIVTNGEISLRLLDFDSPDLPEIREALRAVINDGRRASEIIKRLRTLTKKTEMHRAPLQINEVVAEVIPLVREQVLRNRISLRLDLASGLPVISGDRVQLQQVIINLLVNAMDAMTSIEDRPRELTVQSRRHGVDQVLVAVRDSGVGIDPQTAGGLFEAFFTTKPGGMGMGLSICRSIVDSHGGTIWASRNTGPGSTFQFALPAGMEGVA